MALGPLTNLALAVRLDPTFPAKLKDLFIMGGNMEGNHKLKYVLSVGVWFLNFKILWNESV